MFVSFFPRPRLFFASALLWTALAMGVWYDGGRTFGAQLGLGATAARAVIGVSRFWSPGFLWFYLYYGLAVGLFAGAWRVLSPHPWWRWSILGSALIILVTFLQVEVSVAINDWYGPFFDLVQAALSHTARVTAVELYRQMLAFAQIAVAAVVVGVLILFFASHYVFRWRTAMTHFYVGHWERLRTIEGASQRIQEDAMRFSTTTEDLGVSFINAVLTLLAFIPVLIRLSKSVTQLPIIGATPNGLMIAGIGWAVFGTLFLAALGVRLPGLQFRNQRVEAAFRKELVLGEDDPTRASPPTAKALFANVRRNYFRLYFNYMYFNVGRFVYLQADVVFPFVLLAPSIAAGALTFGLLQQILSAFDQVRGSLQYLISSWTTIVELQSIYKRLRTFEASMEGAPLPAIEGEPEFI